MKIRKQGWVNIYREPEGERFAGSIFVTKEAALSHWKQFYCNMQSEIKLKDTILIEWEEEEL